MSATDAAGRAGTATDDATDATDPGADPVEAGAGDAATSAARRPEAERSGPFADIPLEEDGMPSSEDLRNALRAVVDPEIGYNIVDLGLVYEVTKPARGQAHVLMTLTSMGCPLTEVIHQQCSVILGAMPGVDHVEVEFTFTPPWSTDMIADYVSEELRAMGMNI